MTTLKAETRSRDIKAKKLRREGYVTGNLFGRKIKNSIPLKMAARDVGRILKDETRGGQILLDVEGQVYDVLIKEIDLAPISSQVNEIDFQALSDDEKVHSVAEIVLENTDKVQEGVVQENLTEISYKAYPAALVEKVRLDVASMKVGDVIRVKDLDIAHNPDLDIRTNPEAVVVSVIAVRSSAPAEEEEETEA